MVKGTEEGGGVKVMALMITLDDDITIMVIIDYSDTIALMTVVGIKRRFSGYGQ